jgi:hypothetical protein
MGLLQQAPGARLVSPIAKHELSHNRLGEKLVKRRLVDWRPRRRSAALGHGRVPIGGAPGRTGHHSTTTV